VGHIDRRAQRFEGFPRAAIDVALREIHVMSQTRCNRDQFLAFVDLSYGEKCRRLTSYSKSDTPPVQGAFFPTNLITPIFLLEFTKNQ
jgi:hypothetical protein